MGCFIQVIPSNSQVLVGDGWALAKCISYLALIRLLIGWPELTAYLKQCWWLQSWHMTKIN